MSRGEHDSISRGFTQLNSYILGALEGTSDSSLLLKLLEIKGAEWKWGPKRSVFAYVMVNDLNRQLLQYCPQVVFWGDFYGLTHLWMTNFGWKENKAIFFKSIR